MLYSINRRNIILTGIPIIAILALMSFLLVALARLYGMQNEINLAKKEMSELSEKIITIENTNRKNKENVLDFEMKLNGAWAERNAFAIQAKSCTDIKKTLVKKGLIKP